MLSFLLPLASKIITDAVSKIPDNEELGEKLIEICLTILEKAVLTKTDYCLPSKASTLIMFRYRLAEYSGCITVAM